MNVPTRLKIHKIRKIVRLEDWNDGMMEDWKIGIMEGRNVVGFSAIDICRQ